MEKKIAEIYSKHSTKHAEGGIAGMLGEPRSGYNGGGGAGYQNIGPWFKRVFIDEAGVDKTQKLE